MSPLDALLERSFGRAPGRFVETPLPQHASTRTYARLAFETVASPYPATLVVMRLPPDALVSDEGESGPEPTELPFISVAELLTARGVPVPAIYGHNLAAGLVLLEDLGDETFEDRLRRTPERDWGALYGRAVDVLADMHRRCEDLPEASLPRVRRFNEALLRWELDHFRDWGLEALGGPLPVDDRATLDAAFERLATAIAAGPVGFVHRDYQSRNLMWSPGGELAVIDFQDALTGPRVYDLVALLCDSYVALSSELQDTMIARYCDRRGLEAEASQALEREFWQQALQRKLKDAGRFVFIDRMRKNPSFLRWYPQSLAYVGRALARTPGYEAVGAILERRIPGFPGSCFEPSSGV